MSYVAGASSSLRRSVKRLWFATARGASSATIGASAPSESEWKRPWKGSFSTRGRKTGKKSRT